jgi:SHOCT-like domain
MSDSEDRRRILSLLAEGKINTDEAERLIEALEPEVAASAKSGAQSSKRGPGAFFTGPNFAPFGSGGSPRQEQPFPFDPSPRQGEPSFLHIIVDEPGKDEAERVNIRVPLNMMRASIIAGSFMPPFGTEHAFGHPNGKRIDDMLQALANLKIDLDENGKKVRIFCE